jgi:hypothetical protein
VLDLPGNDVLSGYPLDRAAQVGRQEVMNGPLPPAHAGSHCFLLDVLREGRAFLGQLGVEGGGDIAHGIEGMLISFEEHLLGVLSYRFSQPAVHGLFFSPFGWELF